MTQRAPEDELSGCIAGRTKLAGAILNQLNCMSAVCEPLTRSSASGPAQAAHISRRLCAVRLASDVQVCEVPSRGQGACSSWPRVRPSCMAPRLSVCRSRVPTGCMTQKWLIKHAKAAMHVYPVPLEPAATGASRRWSQPPPSCCCVGAAGSSLILVSGLWTCHIPSSTARKWGWMAIRSCGSCSCPMT